MIGLEFDTFSLTSFLLSFWFLLLRLLFVFRVSTFGFWVCSHFAIHLQLRVPYSGIEFNTLIIKCIHFLHHKFVVVGT